MTVRKRLIFLVLGLVLLAACGGDDTPDVPTFTPAASAFVSPTPRPTLTPAATPTLPPMSVLPTPPNINPDEPARVRIVQAVPDLELVDIYINFSAVAPRFRPGSYSSRPVEVPSGTVQLRMMPAEAPVGNEAALFSQQLELQPFQNLVLYFYGTADSILLEMYETDLSPIVSNSARLYVIHAIPNGPGVNVLLDGDTFAQELIYGEQAGPQDFPEGNYTVEINTGSSRVLTTLEQEFEAREVYTLLIMGDTTTNTYEVIQFSEPANPLTLARLVHASFDTPPVRIFLDDELLVEDFAYPAFTSSFMELESGLHQLRVEAMEAVEGDPPLLDTALVLTNNRLVNLVLYDRFVDLKVGQFEIDETPTLVNQARLSIINAVPFAPEVTAMIPTLITSNTERQFAIPFGEALAPQSVGVGAQSYQFFTGSDETATLLSRTDELMIEAGSSYTYILTGRRGDEGILLSLPVGEEQPEFAAPDTQARVRFINTLPSAISIVVNGEAAQENLGTGELSEPQLLIGETAVAVRGSGNTLLAEQAFLATSEDEQLTVFVAGPLEAVTLYSFTDPEEITLEGRARLRFFSALFDTGTVYPLLIPADEDTTALLGIQPGDNELVRVGQNPFESGRIEVLDMPPGNYTLRIIDLEGVVLYEAPFSMVADLFYDVVLLDTTSGIDLLKIPRPVE